MEFVVVDVETANPDMSSICAVGAVSFLEGSPTEEFYTLVNPGMHFDSVNVAIHGISSSDSRNSPTFSAVYETLRPMLEGKVVVTHTQFDRVAFKQAIKRYDLLEYECKWLDSAKVARRVWADCARSGYGLSKLCARIGYRFTHHHALEDAKAAGMVLLSALRESSLSVEGALESVNYPITSQTGSSSRISRDGNPDGPLFGEVVVFTGSLSIPRREAADLAAHLGCQVSASVTQKTTLLVVGDQDVVVDKGQTKSAKYLKAEEMITRGHSIRVMRESDFARMVNY